MLIRIDGSAVEDALGAGATSARSRASIENLLLAHYHRKHVIWIEPGSLQPIEGEISTRARGALLAIRAESTEIRGLLNRVRWSMCVGLGPTFNGQSTNLHGREIIQANLLDFEDFERAGSTVLLGENLRDAELYRLMAEAFVAGKRWRERVVFGLQQGGGDTTAQALQQLIEDGRIVLAIADSDKHWPEGHIGGTAAKLLPVTRTAFQHVHVLHVRFAENLIRSAVYLEAFTKRPQFDALGRLIDAEHTPCPLPWRDYAELKHGLTLFDVKTIPLPSTEAVFWWEVASCLGRDQCVLTPPVACQRAQDCRCFVTDALGRDALELTVQWLRGNDRFRNAALLRIDGELPPPMADLCEKLLAWGLASPRREV